jgi:hypothetical protein
MTDIVERLAWLWNYWDRAITEPKTTVIPEAISEIERLRSALIAIIDNYDDLNVPRIEVIEDARNLLDVSH